MTVAEEDWRPRMLVLYGPVVPIQAHGLLRMCGFFLPIFRVYNMFWRLGSRRNYPRGLWNESNDGE